MCLARAFGVLTCLGLLACESSPSSPWSTVDPRLQRTAEEEELGSAGGSGQYSINGLIVTFSFNAEIERNGKGKGAFTLDADEGDGLIVDFDAKVTCLSIDPVNGRAWIGGKVKGCSNTTRA